MISEAGCALQQIHRGTWDKVLGKSLSFTVDAAKSPASPGLFIYDLKNDGLAFGKLLLGSEGTGAKAVRTPLSTVP